jgi:hypothetical protein
VSLERRVRRLEGERPEPREPLEVTVHTSVIPHGPCGYVVRQVGEQEWADFAAEHGPEAAARARAYVEHGVCKRVTRRYRDGRLLEEDTDS